MPSLWEALHHTAGAAGADTAQPPPPLALDYASYVLHNWQPPPGAKNNAAGAVAPALLDCLGASSEGVTSDEWDAWLARVPACASPCIGSSRRFLTAEAGAIPTHPLSAHTLAHPHAVDPLLTRRPHTLGAVVSCVRQRRSR